MIVLGTVLLNATTARFIAKIIGVFLTKSEGIIIIGASRLSRLIAQYLKQNNRHVVLIDNNQNNVKKSKALGLEAFGADIYNDNLNDNLELSDVGYLMALTGNGDINRYALKKFKEQFGENGYFRLIDPDEIDSTMSNESNSLLSKYYDFAEMEETASRYPFIHEQKIQNEKHLEDILTTKNTQEDFVPLFFKFPKGHMETVAQFENDNLSYEKGLVLAYLGKELER